MVELGNVPGDQAAERGGVARNLLAELDAAMLEQVIEGFQARGEHPADRLAAIVDNGDHARGALAETVCSRGAVGAQAFADPRAGFLHFSDDPAAMLAQ